MRSVYSRQRTWEQLSPEERKALARFRWPINPRNCIRTAIFSHLSFARGSDAVSSIFGFGPDFLLPAQPFSLVPLDPLANDLTAVWNSLLQETKLAPAIRAIAKSLRGSVSSSSEPDGTIDGIPEAYPMLRSCPLELPSPSQYETIEEAIHRLLEKDILDELGTVDGLRLTIWILLAWAGIPIKNLRRYCPYYGFLSFVSRATTDEFGEEIHFVAMYTQADGGLGAVPIRLTSCTSVIRQWVLALQQLRNGARLHDHRLRRDHRDCVIRATPNMRSLGRLLRKQLPHHHPGKRLTPTAFAAALSAVSNLHAILWSGAFMAHALLDRSPIPPSYFLIQDLLRPAGYAGQLFDLSGQPWRNEWEPSGRRIERDQQRRRMQIQACSGTTGKPVTAGWRAGASEPAALAIDRHLKSASLARQVSFFARHMAQPTLPKIIECLQTAGVRRPERRALWILVYLRKGGHLRLGQPFRFIHPNELSKVLRLTYRFVKGKPGRRKSRPRYEVRCRWHILMLGALFGARLPEAMRLRADDITRVGNYCALRFRGTRAWHADRVFNVDFFTHGSSIVRRTGYLLTAMQRLTPPKQVADKGYLFGHPYRSASAEWEAFSAALHDALDTIAPNPNRSPEASVAGRATYHSLRHAVTFRVIQGLLDRGIHLCGNFSSSLSELANAMGQSLASTLASGLGTAVVVLDWESVRFADPQSPEPLGITQDFRHRLQ